MNQEPPSSDERKTRWGGTFVGCVVIVAFSCALDLFFYTGYYASDDTRYLRPAWGILSQGSFQNEPELAEGRLTIVGWNVLVAALFGFNIPLIAGSYVVFHQLLNLLTFALARRLFDEKVGLLAMYYVATVPLAVTFSTMVLPDLPLTCFLVLSLLMFLWSYDLRAKGKSGAALLTAFLSGLSVGGAYMAKETALVALPFYLVMWLWFERRRAIRSALLGGGAFAVGILVVFAAEWAVLSHLTGHSYVRLSWAVGPEAWTAGLRGKPYGSHPFERVTWLYHHLRPWFANTRFDYLLAGAALLYPFVRGRKLSVWWLAIWLFAFHTWGTTRLTEYTPPPLQPRYFTPILPLLFIVYSFIVLKLWRAVPGLVRGPVWSRRIQTVFAVVLFLHPVFGLHVSDRRAGKVYSADKVNSAVKAIEAGLAGGARPVVLSGTVTRYIGLLLEHYPHKRVLAASDCRADAPLLDSLRETGFYYVEHRSTRRFEATKCPDGLDGQLHPLILSVPAQDEPWLEQQDRLLGSVETGGRRGVLRRLKRFDCWHKRTQQVAYAITPFAGRHPDPYAWSAYLYEWVPDSRRRENRTD